MTFASRPGHGSWLCSALVLHQVLRFCIAPDLGIDFKFVVSNLWL